MRIVRWPIVGIFMLLFITFPRGYASPTQHPDYTVSPIPTFSWHLWIQHAGDLLHRIATFSPGLTYDGRPLWPELLTSFRASGVLIIIALVLTLIFGTLKGSFDGFYTGKRRGIKLLSNAFQWFGESVPDLVIIICLQLLSFFLYAHSIDLSFSGGQQFFSGTVIPACVVALSPTMYLARMVRLKVEDQVGQLYLMTAKAKGINPFRIFAKHLLPNVWPVILTTITPVLGMLFSNIIIVEILLARKGIGVNVTNSSLGGLVYVPQSNGQSIPTLFRYSTDDLATVFFLLLCTFIMFIIIYALLRVIFYLIGYRGQSNTFHAPKDLYTSSRHPWQLIAGGIILALCVTLALVRNWLPIPSPTATDGIHVMGMKETFPPFPPDAQHLLGTDLRGHDMFSMTLHTLLPTYGLIGAAALGTLLAASIFTLLASVTGIRSIRYIIGFLNSVTTVVPTVLLVLYILSIPVFAVAGIHIGSTKITWGFPHMLIYLAAFGFSEFGRTAYAMQNFLDDCEQKTFVEASIVAGSNAWSRFILHHLQPFLIHLGEQSTQLCARLFTLIALLGFLGIPLRFEWVHLDHWYQQITDPTWTGLIANGARDYFNTGDVFPIFAPILFILLTISALSLILIGLRRWNLTKKYARMGLLEQLRLRAVVGFRGKAEVHSF